MCSSDLKELGQKSAKVVWAGARGLRIEEWACSLAKKATNALARVSFLVQKEKLQMRGGAVQSLARQSDPPTNKKSFRVQRLSTSCVSHLTTERGHLPCGQHGDGELGLISRRAHTRHGTQGGPMNMAGHCSFQLRHEVLTPRD